MVDVHPFVRVKKWLSLNRLAILNGQYHAIKDQIGARRKKERDEIEFFTHEFERYSRKAERLAFFRVLLYIFLYATFAVSILKIIPFLGFLVTFIEVGSAVAGGGIAVVLIFFLTVKVNMHFQRMQACLMHLVVFYHQNPKRDTTATLQRLSRVI